ncbi:protein kinase family protein [Paenarthrobacter sp. PH39-S1]|uniref:protein kinase family protein n=1 Tax=Paenarthrobacter sp. PH39-S1 TaxID=3046204 RepID=UPI0024BB4C20|nr:protein kinase family protein [Paenarthrobacter sp. PH39-S1]MDJ0358581.1 protein kinase family protein [Paenarthrobacter sp. PH39-S1]
MPLDSLALMLTDIAAKYEARPSSPAFARLYEEVGRWGHMFAVLHEELNNHFEAINGRAETTGHYWAQPSRDFLELIKDLKEDLYALKRAGVDAKLVDKYQQAIERCQPWLSPSGGSTVPEDFEPVAIIKYEQVFSETSSSVNLKKQQSPVELKMIGSGSYANVYAYVDPDYGIKFAVKRAKRDVNERDLQRFRQEFDVMKALSFPYIVEVYKFDETRNEYRMEFCDETLRNYISKRNGNLHFSTRKRVALQFLYGISYIHSQNFLHRDISRRCHTLEATRWLNRGAAGGA